MFKVLSEDEFITANNRGEKTVIYKEILGDLLTPVQAYLALGELTKGGTLLESEADSQNNHSRYAFIGFTMIDELKLSKSDNALLTIKEFFNRHRSTMDHPLCGFTGGVVGYCAYEAAALFEPALASIISPDTETLIHLKAYRDHILFDLHKQTIVLATLEEKGYHEAMERLNTLERIISQPQVMTKPISKTHQSTTLETTDSKFIESVNTIQSHIKKGDVFQLVLSRCFNQKLNTHPFDLYRVIRSKNPSPYMFYLDDPQQIILGASPEKLISVREGKLQSCPLAGTRAIGESIQSLLNDEKENAEHMMLVDLARNDLGVTAKIGTVKVVELKAIKQFSHVMHLSSTVEAELAQGKDALDAFAAAFPAGTLSGAPKIRAMQLIRDLEKEPRGIYGGAIFYLDNRGNLDSCITIRSGVINNGILKVRAGAGIVADSNPQSEADETRHKANAVLEAVKIAQGGYV